MNILITGSSGLVGNALFEYFSLMNHQVFRLVRKPDTEEPFFWQPSENLIHLNHSIHLDVVIHLAGESIGEGRWTVKRKQAIYESRVHGTYLIAKSLANLKYKPKVFISGSAIGYYGDTGNDEIDENGENGSGFLAEVCQQWEKGSQHALDADIRTVQIRMGIVLSTMGGALKRMLLPFKMGIGGAVGSGHQYMSWVSISDVCHMINFIIENESISGPVNIVSNTPVTNFEFTKILGEVLHRWALLQLPAFVVRFLLGEMADELLLSSIRAIPNKLNKAGYRFKNNDLKNVLTKLIENGQ